MSIQDDKNAIQKSYLQLLGYTHVFGMVKMNGKILDDVPEAKFNAQGQERYEALSGKTIQTMTAQIEEFFDHTLSHDRAEALAYSYRKTHLEISLEEKRKLHEDLMAMKNEDDDTLYSYIVYELPIEEVRTLQSVNSITLIEFVSQAEANGFTQIEAHQTALAFLDAPGIL